MKLKISDKTITVAKPITLWDLANQEGISDIYVAKVNGRLRELTYKVTSDATIEFLTLANSDAARVYEATLRFVFAMALNRLDKSLKMKFNYSVSRSILATIDGKDFISKQLLSNLAFEVDRIIEKNLPIVRKQVSIDEAIKIYTEEGLLDKIDILKYREEKMVNMYEVDGYYNYMFSYMLPFTGLLKSYKAFTYVPGFILQYPRAEFGGRIPEFVDAPTFGKALKEVTKWGEIIGGNTIAQINNHTYDRDSMVDFVNLCETKHNGQLARLGDMIEADINDIKLIAVAGPSSSGKTTFTNRLRIELMSRGIKPQMISMDDYYLGKEQAPKDEAGKPDLEHVQALDVQLFNSDMAALVAGEKVTLPKFNFKTGLRETGHTLQLTKGSPILIEGIHALNESLTSLIPNHQKFKIYIAPQTQLHIDDHNPISITDLRLLRRSVRDVRYRNSPVTQTMDMWSSVRRGEFRWIYPNQEGVNFVFNSELTYEFAILKKYALSHLMAIPNDDPHFITANRLIKFLKYFREIDEDLIPSNSLLLEFIGGSPFHD